MAQKVKRFIPTAEYVPSVDLPDEAIETLGSFFDETHRKQIRAALEEYVEEKALWQAGATPKAVQSRLETVETAAKTLATELENLLSEATAEAQNAASALRRQLRSRKLPELDPSDTAFIGYLYAIAGCARAAAPPLPKKSTGPTGNPNLYVLIRKLTGIAESAGLRTRLSYIKGYGYKGSFLEFVEGALNLIGEKKTNQALGKAINRAKDKKSR